MPSKMPPPNNQLGEAHTGQLSGRGDSGNRGGDDDDDD